MVSNSFKTLLYISYVRRRPRYIRFRIQDKVLGDETLKIQTIPTTNISKTPPFKCHKGTTEKIRDYGKVIKDTGIINGKRLDIYSAYDLEGNLIHKLYYLADSVGNWIKSKLKYYENGKVVKEVRSER